MRSRGPWQALDTIEQAAMRCHVDNPTALTPTALTRTTPHTPTHLLPVAAERQELVVVYVAGALARGVTVTDDAEGVGRRTLGSKHARLLQGRARRRGGAGR